METKNINKYPDPLAPFNEKKTNEYGLKIAYLIAKEWFNGGFITGSTSCEYAKRRDWIRKKRLFIRGEQNIDYYKNFFAYNDGDLEYLNIDWRPVNWAEKFALIVSNGISDDNYKLNIKSIDRLSAINKKNKEKFYQTLMYGKEIIKSFKDNLGIDIAGKNFIPESQEELNLYMELNERPKIEIAEELLIDYVKQTNEWDYIEKEKNKDVVNLGIIVCRIWIDKNDGVKIKYVDPESYIHSAVKTNNFSDKYYEGVVETITISDLIRESDFDEPTIRKIAQKYSNYNKPIQYGYNYSNCDISLLVDYKIDILRFAYKTSKTIKYKTKLRNGKVTKLSKKDDTFKAPKREDVGELSKTLDTWFEGNYIVGTDYIYDYKECENIYDDIMNKAHSPYVSMAVDMYENRLRSFTDNIEIPVVQLQKAHLKIQQLMQELKPDIIELDLDMLAELDEGKGGSKKETWETALSLLNIKGVVFKKRVNMGDEGIKDQTAVRTYAQSQGSALAPLLNIWGHYYNLIRENTGINPARDGAMQQDSLVGTNQLAQLASNTVTKNIVDTTILFNKKVYEVISSRIHSIYKYKEAKKLKDLYNSVLDKRLMDSVELMKNRHLHEFGFVFEVLPTREELQEFKESLTIALQEQTIDIDDKIQAESIAKSNIKLANQFLSYQRKKKIKQRQEEQMMLSKNKSENDAMAAQSKIKADMEAYQFKKQMDIEFEKQKAELDIMKAQRIKEINAPFEELDFRRNAELKSMETYNQLDREKYKEDRKDDRINKQNTQQSKMISQRKNNSEPIDFEDEYDF